MRAAGETPTQPAESPADLGSPSSALEKPAPIVSSLDVPPEFTWESGRDEYYNEALGQPSRPFLGYHPVPLAGYGWPSATQAAADQWRVGGEIVLGTGAAGYFSRELQGFTLTETYATARGNEYRFLQRYRDDHSWVSSGGLEVGAEQRFPSILWNGDLALEETFKLYRDRGFSLNNRQEGLFRLRFSPEWCQGAWQAHVSYLYNVRKYETFIDRSYIHHRGRVELARQIGESLRGEVFASLDDHNFSVGSDFSSSKLSTGTRWSWQPSTNLDVTAGVSRDEKAYAVRKVYAYDRTRWQAQAKWQPDSDSTVSAQGSITDYTREMRPDLSYEDTQVKVGYERELTSKVDAYGELYGRRKRFSAEPLNDLSVDGGRVRVDWYPGRALSLYVDLNRSVWDYNRTTRSFTLNSGTVGGSYSRGPFSADVDYSHGVQSYTLDTGRDFARDDLWANFAYRCGRHRGRIYGGFGQLNQDYSLSVNDYRETRLGAEWSYAVDSSSEFSLRYDFDRRDYGTAFALRESVFETRLAFGL